MSFNYQYTCPTVDKNIESFKDTVKDRLSEMLDEACPLLEGVAKSKFIEGYSDTIYQDVEPLFEDVRKTNSNMREEAERQIDVLNDIISDKDEEIQNLQEELSNAEC